MQSSNKKLNCCKNHQILFCQLQLQIKNQSFLKKINWLHQLLINVSIKSFKIWKINQQKISTLFFNSFRMSENTSIYNINRCFTDLKKTFEIWIFHYRNNHFSRIYHDQINQSSTFQSTINKNIENTFFQIRNRRFCFKINLRIKFSQFKHVQCTKCTIWKKSKLIISNRLKFKTNTVQTKHQRFVRFIWNRVEMTIEKWKISNKTLKISINASKYSTNNHIISKYLIFHYIQSIII